MNYKISLDTFQRIYAVSKSDLHEADKMTEMVSIVSGQPNDQVEGMSLPDFIHLAKKVVTILEVAGVEQTPTKYITVDGKTFGFTYNVNGLKSWQYAKLIRLMKNSSEGTFVKNLHLFAACIVHPVKVYKLLNIRKRANADQYEATAELLKRSGFDSLLGACVYFQKLWNSSIEKLRPILIKETLRKTDVLKRSQVEGVVDLAIKEIQL